MTNLPTWTLTILNEEFEATVIEWIEDNVDMYSHETTGVFVFYSQEEFDAVNAWAASQELV